MAERLTEAQILAQISAVRKRAKAETAEPRAASARYEAGSGRVVVELASGAAFAFQAAGERELATLAPEALAEIRVTSGGRALHWPAADVHMDVPGLIAHVVNLVAWAPRYLGSRSSEAKARAARENGRKGGRPRKRAAEPES